jgi:hypothetical protein
MLRVSSLARLAASSFTATGTNPIPSNSRVSYVRARSRERGRRSRKRERERGEGRRSKTRRTCSPALTDNEALPLIRRIYRAADAAPFLISNRLSMSRVIRRVVDEIGHRRRRGAAKLREADRGRSKTKRRARSCRVIRAIHADFRCIPRKSPFGRRSKGSMIVRERNGQARQTRGCSRLPRLLSLHLFPRKKVFSIYPFAKSSPLRRPW